MTLPAHTVSDGLQLAPRVTTDTRKFFENSHRCKLATLSALEASVSTRDAIQSLKSTEQANGTIYVIGDTASRFSADHLAEEFQVRYRAGKAFGRDDRPAVPSTALTEYQIETLSALTGNFKRNDSLVLFADGTPSPHLEKMVINARLRNVNCIVICDDGNKGLVALSGIGAKLLPIVGEPSSGARFSLQRALIHGICEAFEPEFKGDGRAVLIDGVRQSLTVDTNILENGDLLRQMAGAREALAARVNSGGAVFLFGNGGSACDAQELTAELRGRRNSSGVPVLASNFLQAGYMTCAVNDGHEIFRRGVEGVRGENHVVIAYSTSGVSDNVNRAVTLAREKGMLTIALTGKDGGKLAPIADMPLIVPSQDTGRIQEAHALIGFYLASGLS